MLYSIVLLCSCVTMHSADFVTHVRTLYNKVHKKIDTILPKPVPQQQFLAKKSDNNSIIQNILYETCVKRDVQVFFYIVNHYHNKYDTLDDVLSYKILQAAYDDPKQRIFAKLIQRYSVDLRILLTDAFYKKYDNECTSRLYIKSLIMSYPDILKTPHFLALMYSILQSNDILIKEDPYEYFQRGFNPFVVLCSQKESMHTYIPYFFHEHNSRLCAQFFMRSYTSGKPVVFIEHDNYLYVGGDGVYRISSLALTAELVCCLMSFVCYFSGDVDAIVSFLVKRGWAAKVVDNYNRTLLHRAVLAGAGRIVNAFLKYSDTAWLDDFKNTPLAYACLGCDKVCFDILVHNPCLLHKSAPFTSEKNDVHRLYSIRQNQQEKAILKYMCDFLTLNSFVRGCDSAQSLCDCVISTCNT